MGQDRKTQTWECLRETQAASARILPKHRHERAVFFEGIFDILDLLEDWNPWLGVRNFQIPGFELRMAAWSSLPSACCLNGPACNCQGKVIMSSFRPSVNPRNRGF